MSSAVQPRERGLETAQPAPRGGTVELGPARGGSAAAMLALQRSAGNAAVSRYLATGDLAGTWRAADPSLTTALAGTAIDRHVARCAGGTCHCGGACTTSDHRKPHDREDRTCSSNCWRCGPPAARWPAAPAERVTAAAPAGATTIAASTRHGRRARARSAPSRAPGTNGAWVARRRSPRPSSPVRGPSQEQRRAHPVAPRPSSPGHGPIREERRARQALSPKRTVPPRQRPQRGRPARARHRACVS